MSKRYFFTIIMLLVIAGVTAMAFKESIHGQVVCFGDSITYGAQADGQSWVSFLSKKHADIDFINEGRSGRKTSDKKELLPVLDKYSNSDYYLLFLGVNDLKDGTDSMVNDCIINMAWMITQIRITNPKARIVILSPSDINLKTMNEINSRKKYNENTKKSLAALEKKYKNLAKKENVGFISLLHAVSKLHYADGLHPNVKGQEEIATAVWKGLNKLY
jgi:acyl-CoA thioesterase I